MVYNAKYIINHFSIKVNDKISHYAKNGIATCIPQKAA